MFNQNDSTTEARPTPARRCVGERWNPYYIPYICFHDVWLKVQLSSIQWMCACFSSADSCLNNVTYRRTIGHTIWTFPKPELTFHHWKQLPNSYPPSRGVLAQRSLQQEQRNPSEHQCGEIGDKECPCREIMWENHLELNHTQYSCPTFSEARIWNRIWKLLMVFRSLTGQFIQKPKGVERKVKWRIILHHFVF